MTKQIIIANSPIDKVNLTYGEPDSTFKIINAQLPELKPGQILVKVLYLSNDPTQRTWMIPKQDTSRSYHAPILEGDVVKSFALGEVLESKSDKFAKGDIVNGEFGWLEELVADETSVFNKIDVSAGLPLPVYSSILGVTGLTAYFGITEVGQLKKGQSVLVSAASGATGSTVVQLAKHVIGASKVIGIAGSDEKCKWVESLGADYCVNYRDSDWQKKLSDYIGQDYVDVYYDNVGGEQLSFALGKVKRHGRIVACGSISGYNDPAKLAVTTWNEIITNRLTVQGFIVSDYIGKIHEGIGALVLAIQTGKVKITEGMEVVDLSSEKVPLEKVPETWYKLFTAEKPLGKLITKI